ncbi:MAG: 50S ribosomal protein L19 [Parcubacteria group bacterium]|nr:50S ribosomal protein L19 [Parcubacteria group bacterium]
MTGKKNIPEIKPGWTVRVSQRIKEGEKTRVQAFEGVIIGRKHGSETGATFTVRKIIDGIGVEKIFPLFSPTIEKIEVTKKAKVRRSKLYYIRRKSKKEIRRKIKNISMSSKSSNPSDETQISKSDPTSVQENATIE